MTGLLAGCSGAGDGPESDGRSGGRSDASASAGERASDGTAPDPGGGAGTSAVPTATRALEPDPARSPTTRAAALDLIRRVIADPDSFGSGVVKRSPYESGPATWPVLGKDCVWHQGAPGYGVLATLGRSFELPASAGKGPVRLAATVTVHRTREGAAWEVAESIEESMRCPTQRLRDGELIGGLVAGALFGGEANQNNSDDFLSETGQYRSSELGGPHYYAWQQAQAHRFTVSVTGKGAKGRTEREIDDLVVQAQAAMLVRLRSAVEKQS
ncbi:hypothetical protein [Streptomyces sp. V2I9]|uniref:hypothetical protein n=1 Tax=Streptomyces sp. V2I9 TaxID=3042304 RepID=UPI0027D7A510|nr:hypothetical protein [Streptomyces sp. V2I9]